MFESFFPKPKLFFSSFALWSLACVLFWFSMGEQVGEVMTLGEIFGFVPLDYESLNALLEEVKKFNRNTSPENIKLVEVRIESLQSAATFWFYQYLVPCYGIFLGFWYWFGAHRWRKWSLFGSAAILFATWFQVQLDVMINNWFGDFYDMIGIIFKEPGSITEGEYYGRLLTFLSIAAVAVIMAFLLRFFVQHYNFRWRTAMNDHYMGLWDRVRHIEGASQRVQDDTMRFAEIMEGLGVDLLDAIMTLIAFLPILWILSEHVSELPLIGPVAQGLVIAAVIWSVFGMIVLMLTGYRLPGLEFLNQRVEHAYRKELVFGENNIAHADPMTIKKLFDNVRKNYFKLYFHYMYFNLTRFSYLQAGVLVPYVALAPTLLSKEAILAGFTLGVMQQTVRAFGRVESSFQFLVHNWATIVKLLSIYKRLKAFDAISNNQPLPKIDQDFIDEARK